MNSFIRVSMLLACLAGAALPPVLAYGAEPATIGVLAYRPKPQTLAQWQPLAVALNQAIPARDFVVEAYTSSELDMAVAAGRLDFVLTNPRHYLLLARRSGLSSPLATLATNEGGQQSTVLGGVIFSLAGQADIDTLGDIKGKTIAVAGSEYLGGYLAQAYELSRAGIRLPQDAQLITVGMPFDNVVETVLIGGADVGFVRSGVLEGMAREGKLDMKQIKVVNHQHPPEFGLQVSTRLYPEWPFAVMPHVEENLARHVARALLMLEENTAATRAIGIHGFVVPADYTPVESLLRELRVPPFDVTPAFTLQDVWARYRWQAMGALAAIGLIVALGLRLLFTTRKLESQHRIVLLHQQKLEESEKRFQLAVEGAEEGIWDIDLVSGETYHSPRMRQMLGYTDDELPPDREAWDAITHPEDLPNTRAQLQAHFDSPGQEFQNLLRLRHRDGTWRWILSRGRTSADANGRTVRFTGTHMDITERKRMEDQVRQLAFHDALTRLPNRRLLSDRLSQIMAASKRSGRYGALMFVDLDNFKSLNDTHGHVAGDLLLIEAADRLRSCVREMDTVARFGGDEFVVLLSELDADKTESTSQARIVAEKIRIALAEPYLVTFKQEGKADMTVEHHCTASIGVVVFIGNESSQGDILRWADGAMYQAKLAGRDLIRFHVSKA